MRAAETEGFSFRRYSPSDGGVEGEEYDLTKIPKVVPIGIIYGVEDKLADPVDIRRLISEIGDAVVFDKGLLGYEHIDFTWSKHAARDVYPDVMRLLETNTADRREDTGVH